MTDADASSLYRQGRARVLRQGGEQFDMAVLVVLHVSYHVSHPADPTPLRGTRHIDGTMVTASSV